MIPRPTAVRLAAVLLVLSGSAFLMSIITAEALFPAPYTTSHNTISDLGSTWQPGNIVREPSATIFNTMMILVGLMIGSAAVALYRAKRSRGVPVTLGILGTGMLGVGIFHGTEIGGHFSNSGVHPLFATVAFLAGGLCGIVAYRTTTSPFRYLSALLGGIALLAFVLSSPLSSTGLGAGGTLGSD